MGPRLPRALSDDERWGRFEALLETICERQREQHAENVERHKAMAAETREHRHKTANALMANEGRLVKLSGDIERQGERVDGILALVPVAAAERKGLDERLKTIETIVAEAKVSWRTVAWIFALLSAVIAGLAGAVTAVLKVVSLLGYRT